jgi:hypothetical protein
VHRELSQPRTRADGKPVTESNLILCVPAQIPADLGGSGERVLCCGGVTDEGDLYAVGVADPGYGATVSPRRPADTGLVPVDALAGWRPSLVPADTGEVIDIGCIANATGLASVASAHPRQLYAQGGGQAGALRRG